MKKATFLYILFIAIFFTSCSNSIVNTEWVNVASDISIKFIDDKNAIIKAGTAGDIPISYKYDKPKIVLSKNLSKDMHGIVENDKMTFYGNLVNGVFVKK